MDLETTLRLAEELEKEGEVAWLHENGYLYVIRESCAEEGYMVDKYDPFDLEDGPFDGGFCTGTAIDAVEFML